MEHLLEIGYVALVSVLAKIGHMKIGHIVKRPNKPSPPTSRMALCALRL
jgi:hypothetical protein